MCAYAANSENIGDERCDGITQCSDGSDEARCDGKSSIFVMHVVPSCMNASESQIAALGFLVMMAYVPQFLVYDVMAPMTAMMAVMKQIVVTI